ncbi:MAG: hypothetical protein E7573_01935 [Ruminococcaceae bacterium]|nr:hypothetical protein [Oscillospiraceae bacterium]
MRIYIASKYIEHKNINRKIFEMLQKENISVFLPKSINVDAITLEEMLYVAETCYDEIEKCNVIVIVAPFGKSVSSEIGYAIALKRSNPDKKIILYNYKNNDKSLSTEAMIMPYLDAETNNIDELIRYIKNCS